MNYKTGERLAKYRKKANMSQEELADKLNVSRQAVSKWERGESSPGTDNLIALASLYNITLDDLLNKDPDETFNSKKEETKEEDNKKEYVHIGKDGIHVKDKDTEVHIDASGVHEFANNVDTSEISNNIAYEIKRKRKYEIISSIISGILFLIVTAIYLTLGFVLKDKEGWRVYWTLFFIPFIITSIVDCFKYKRLSKLNVTFMVTFAYLFTGMYLGLWHPTWIVFIFIPIFYSLVCPIEKHIKNKKNISVEEKNKKDSIDVEIKD